MKHLLLHLYFLCIYPVIQSELHMKLYCCMSMLYNSSLALIFILNASICLWTAFFFTISLWLASTSLICNNKTSSTFITYTNVYSETWRVKTQGKNMQYVGKATNRCRLMVLHVITACVLHLVSVWFWYTIPTSFNIFFNVSSINLPSFGLTYSMHNQRDEVTRPFLVQIGPNYFKKAVVWKKGDYLYQFCGSKLKKNMEKFKLFLAVLCVSLQQCSLHNLCVIQSHRQLGHVMCLKWLITIVFWIYIC